MDWLCECGRTNNSQDRTCECGKLFPKIKPRTTCSKKTIKMALKSVANTIDGRRKMSQEEMVRILTAVKRIEDAINYRNTEVL